MRHYEELAKNFLQELISFETVNPPGREEALARRIAEIMQSYGFDTELQEVESGRCNVIIKLGDHPNKIIFNGHLDVVPSGEGWKNPPFSLTEENGKFYGRGTCDMKGALAAMMAMAVKVKEENTLGNQELLLVFVMDEEVGGNGTRHFAKHFQKGNRNWVVVGEPTRNHIFVGHRGIVRLKVTLEGVQCHAGQPHKGINANVLMAQFILEVEKLNQRMQQRKPEMLPAPNVSVTKLNGGIKDNVIPGECEAILDFRTVPGDTVESLMGEIETILQKLFADKKKIGWKVECYLQTLGGVTSPEHPLVKTVAEATKMVQGKEPFISYFDGCCDMSLFLEQGLDAIICGPGSLDQAHTVDEYMAVSEFYEAIAIYEEIVRKSSKME
ncbi:MAG: M20 family metallopeptidase [Eubacteriales bacterium]|nr:M20 family metallopeptidase [Eubacteriales bacterium]